MIAKRDARRRYPTDRCRFVLVAALGVFSVGQARSAPAITAIGIENQYANVIGQIGGRYVTVRSILTDPNTDPHTFEASPKVAARIAAASLIVENGLGYDGWADKIIAGAPNPHRIVINVQHLLHLPGSTANPHLWYAPATMRAVATAVTGALARLDPAHAGYFRHNLANFTRSLRPWLAAIASFRARFPGTRIAVTEPVADDLLQAMGASIETPFTLQVAIMNGTDPSPQDVATQNALLDHRRVKIFVYNQQVTDPLTTAFLNRARRHHIPVVGVYETMPAPGYTYQTWMLAEVEALQRAVISGTSTRSLLKPK